MRLINIKAFLEREQLMRIEGKVDRRTKVLEFRDDETTEYAILSHRWIDPTEVDYEEMADLAKMDRKEQNEIRDRLGYKKIVDTCQQAKRDGYEWVWVDTSCIDKRSSAELSEAINSMYRWYRNARICYAYLHDVHGSSFPTKEDKEEYPKSKGWPEWFSRGWTLQEMIAPSDVQFFNKDWQPIGDKKTLAPTLTKITRVPGYILTGGLSSNRPCVARIMSWAANRMTTRIEDIAYSLMGLLDVNMPMLYGEGKKAFHRLQLEIIRTSNDQSIFAWSRYPGRPGSILADEPSFFNDCSEMVSLDYKEFTERLEASVRIRREQVPQLSFGVFPITNRGIQIWMLLRRHPDSDSIFEAVLPCRTWGPLVTIDLAVWNSNYYRYSPISGHRAGQPLEFRQVYLRYQDPCSELTFEIDDSAITENGFTCHDAYPSKLTGTTLTLTSTRPFCVKSYSKSQDNGLFAVSFGQYFGQDWVQIINDPPSEFGWSGEAGAELMLGGPGRAYSMADMPSQRDSRVWVYHICLPGSSSIVRISRVVWKKSRIGVRIEIFRDSGFHKGLNEWRALEVDRAGEEGEDIRGLMLRHRSYKPEENLIVDMASVGFSFADRETRLGDYGYFSDSGNFCCQGNLFADITTHIPKAHTIPRQVSMRGQRSTVSVRNGHGLSLPSNHAFNSMLTSLSPEHTNAYLVTRVVQCVRKAENGRDIYMTLCTIRKPLVWNRDEAHSVRKGTTVFRQIFGLRRD